MNNNLVDSRRAFPLESRAVWVEQQHVGEDSFVVPKDNRILGPGEYRPTLSATTRNRHVGSPAIGGSRGFVDHFHPFRSGLSISTPLRGGSIRAQQIAAPYNIVDYIPFPGKDLNERSCNEGSTIFHGHDRRNPLDPKARFCKTPGPLLAHDSLLETKSCFGVNKPQNVTFGPDDIPFGERTQVKLALPDYDIQYDSKYLKRAAPLGKISPADRKLFMDAIFEKAAKEGKTFHPALAVNPGPSTIIKDRDRARYKKVGQSPIKMPIIRSRAPPAMKFDSSCYQSKQAAVDSSHADLTPNAIKRQAKIELFNEYLAIPRKHQAAYFPSKIADKVRRGAFGSE